MSGCVIDSRRERGSDQVVNSEEETVQLINVSKIKRTFYEILLFLSPILLLRREFK